MAKHSLAVSQTGADLLNTPLLNKGTAFSQAEREALKLLGLLPPRVESLDTQVQRAYEAYQRKTDDLERHIYLRALQDANEVLFYRLVIDHITEMMPMIYTPVVGMACQKFSEIYRRQRGLFIAYPERDRIAEILKNTPVPQVEAIVVTDGERILGLGDQGAGGMGIPIGKLSLYTACGGISPNSTLPILLDVGTNNQDRLNDPTYIGWRHERIRGDDYYAFIEQFVQAVKKQFPNVLLQFEDFAQTHAAPLLARYRDQLCTFNDDIQGTASVTVGTLLSAVKVTKSTLADQRIVMFGAGSAGCGIAEQIVATMVKEGLPEKEARERFYMIDRPGLLHDGMQDLLPFQTKLLQSQAKVADWADVVGGQVTLMDVIKHAQPTILIGVSGQANAFHQQAVEAMAAHCERPIIFPLSNPTSKIEAVPADILHWTKGRALVATGSPFAPVEYEGRSYTIAQCNNSYIFPAMGLGILSSGAHYVSDAMFMAASESLSQHAPALKDPTASLLPELENVRDISKDIAFAVAKQAVEEGYAEKCSDDELMQKINQKHWAPIYPDLERV